MSEAFQLPSRGRRQDLPAVSGRPRKILVIEDDHELRDVVQRAARCVDPEVEVDYVDRADLAVSRLLSRGPYDLVLADFMLPENCNGYWLRPHCEKLQPQAAFAMMSSMPLRPAEAEDCAFLRKPFTLAECAEFMQKALR